MSTGIAQIHRKPDLPKPSVSTIMNVNLKGCDRMKLIIVRHADPDYSIDSLTPRGWVEADCLADRLRKLHVNAFYCSPLGRARDTAAVTLKAMDREAEILPWLQEFPAKIHKSNREGLSVTWDWLPADWTDEPVYYQMDAWAHTDTMVQANTAETYAHVIEELDALLARHGYEREKNLYRAVRPNKDTIVLFCHFGLECVLLSHLLNIPPMLLWHGTAAAPSSVTIVNTEERREGIAYFRMSTFGDTSHLYAAGKEPSFSARFCETYADFDPKRDR